MGAADELTDRQKLFLEYLLDPRTPTVDGKGSQAEFARNMGVHPITLTKWKKDPRFKLAWEQIHTEVSGGIARYQEMLNRLYEIAMGEHSARAADMRAAVMNYLELTDRYAPKRVLEIKDPNLIQMEDKDLVARTKARLRVIEGGKSRSS